MKKALLLATFSSFVLSLAACNHSNDITGINSAAPEAELKTLVTANPLADGSHKVVVQAPSQPAPLPHIRSGTPTPTLTPTPTSHL